MTPIKSRSKVQLSPTESQADLGLTLSHQILAAILRNDRRDTPAISSEQLIDELDETDLVTKGAYYKHLSTLDKMDVIDWNRETDDVTRGPRFFA
jgi:hypothetical protein